MSSAIYRYRFAWLILAAIIVDFIPFIKLPFLWSQTFFHEISHGLAAVLTGGKIISITIDFIGSGLCVSQGGIPFVVSFAGYFGSAVWGMLIYLAADNMKPKVSHLMMALFIFVLVLTMILWAKGISTYIVLGVMIGLFVVFLKFTAKMTLKYILQFIGIFVLLDAIRSPLMLIDGQDRGDGANLSALTYVPEIVWVSVWFFIGIGCFFIIFKTTYGKVTMANSHGNE